MKTLYLLGNGFDLACGLPSRYSDYFNNRFSVFPGFEKDKPTAVTVLEEELQTNDCHKIPSAWFFIFAYYHDQNNGKCASTWKDVESIIETFTINENAYINLSIGMCADMFAYPRTPTGQEEHVAHLIWLYERLRTNDQFQNTDVDVYKLFLKELKNFESDFQEYLATAVNENIPYRERADQLFKEITEAQTPIQEESFAIGSVENYASFSSGRDDHYVLSFNFTRPLTNSPTFANIHGSLQDKNAFFGIGGTSQYTEDDDLPNAVRFTKAERSLSLGVTGTNTDLDSVFRALQSPEENLRVIKFFGLSLGDADYPYLKQFFDKSHITDTDSGVNSFLGFYYTKGQARDELVHSINSLLQRYSSDTGHKPIGGLMRELQNTGRLTIEELQVACD